MRCRKRGDANLLKIIKKSNSNTVLSKWRESQCTWSSPTFFPRNQGSASLILCLIRQSSLILNTICKTHTLHILPNIIYLTLWIHPTFKISRTNLVLFSFIFVTLQNALILIFSSCKGAYNYTISMQLSPRRQCSAVFKRIFKVRKIWICELSSCKSLLRNPTRFQILHLKKKTGTEVVLMEKNINIKWNNGQAMFSKKKIIFTCSFFTILLLLLWFHNILFALFCTYHFLPAFQ